MSDDTLEKIASKYFLDCDDICRLNGIYNDDLIPGMFIALPNSGDIYDLYIVKEGDTLFSLSQLYDIDLDVLYAINGLDDGDYIYPNQELLIPKDGISIYITKDNESLSDISSNINVPISMISNNNPNLILTSDQLVFFR